MYTIGSCASVIFKFLCSNLSFTWVRFKLGFLYCAFHGGVLDRTLDEYWGCSLNWGAVIFRDFTVLPIQNLNR